MKKTSIVCLAGMLFFAACENNNSSTVGTYENDETSSSADKKEGTSKEENLNSYTENVRDVNIDTGKNITGVSKDSVTSKNKKDTSTKADQKNVKVQKTKKVDAKH
ncbi:MAG: hypothetical protein WKG06_45340 [Segetibacter sp.]